MKLKSHIIPRLYQQTIFSTCSQYNTLVVLPTGLGKTIIGILGISHYLSLFPDKKVILFAPTKPLCDQHYQSLLSSLDIDEDKVAILTGSLNSEKRQEVFKSSSVLIATPQGIENDLISNKINLSQVSLIIFDEAHRGVGNYAYSFIAKQFSSYTKEGQSRIIALTASPGTTSEKVKEVCQTLFIEKVEIRSESDPDVKPYVNKTNVQYVSVELTPELVTIQHLLIELFKKKIFFLKELGLSINASIKKIELLQLQKDLVSTIKQQQDDFSSMKAMSIIAELLKISHAQELLETQGPVPLKKYFDNIISQASKSSTKANKNLVAEAIFSKVHSLLVDLEQKNILHPKKLELKKLLDSYYKKNIDSKQKIILFTHFRENASQLVDLLNDEFGYSAHLFLGQSKKNGVGFSQKEQKRIIDSFRDGKFEILVSTSIGEEGLDIPRVDAVIFYEPIPSAIRTIQRRGRTGRHDVGHMYVLVCKNTRDEVYKWVAHRKEKNMYKILSNLKKEGLVKDDSSQSIKSSPNMTLNQFSQRTIQTKSSNISESLDEEEGEVESTSENKYLITVDFREKNSSLVRSLIDFGISINLSQLSVGDYIISNRVAVEYKSQLDFINSILDKRLFEQLKSLKSNVLKPLLVIEGNEDLFSLRRIPVNVIQSVMYMITVSYGIPIIQTKNSLETANLFSNFVRKEIDGGSESTFSFHAKKPKDPKDQLEYAVSSLPLIGGKLAKELLSHFSTYSNLVKATELELKKVPLVGKEKARTLFDFFRQKY